MFLFLSAAYTYHSYNPAYRQMPLYLVVEGEDMKGEE